MTDWQGVLAFLGFLVVLIPWASGAYQWARWGWAGQVAIHSMRWDLDQAVAQSLREALTTSVREELTHERQA